MSTTFDEALSQLGLSFKAERQAVGGGCIGQAWQMTTADGRRCFVKYVATAESRMLAGEAAGLKAMADTDSVLVPEVLEYTDHILALSWLEPARAAAPDWARAGAALAAMHNSDGPGFGFSVPTFCGHTIQPNQWEQDGYVFFADKRLRYQVRLARDRDLLGQEDVKRIEALCNKLPHLVPEQKPGLLHGDLWRGNFHPCTQGIAMVDPAAWYGWPEAELAMTTLFGEPPLAFYQAYEHVCPQVKGWRERADLYNLYHLLNHLNLFGVSYLGGVRSVLKQYV